MLPDSSTMNKFEDIRREFARELSAADSEFAAALNGYGVFANGILDAVPVLGGKKIRPILLFLTARLCGSISDESISLAALVELIHCASLMHDDVVDNADMRRGHKSLNAVWGNRAAILSGDLLIASAVSKSISDFGNGVSKLVLDTIAQMSEAELNQIEREKTLDCDEAKYLDVISKKTASLMSLCCTLGAVSANAPEKTTKLAGLFGHHFGMAYQLRDDLLDFETDTETGKPVCTDLPSHNLTLPAIHHLHSLPPHERENAINRINKGDRTDLIIADIRNSDGMDYTRKAIEQYSKKALGLLDSLDGDTSTLRTLVETMACRKS